MIPVCRIEMLGGLRVVQSDRVMTRFQTQKTGALLAYCALHPHRSFAREAIAELLWPGGDPTAIRNRLNQAVSSLRRQLHPPGTIPGAVLVADHYTIRINADAVVTDVSEFIECLREAAESENEHDAAAQRRSAVELYRGDLLEGYQEDWVAPERIRLRDQFLEAASWLIKHYAAHEQLDAAIDLAARRLEFDSQSEVFHRTLIRLYLKAGRAKSALAHAEQFERTLTAAGHAISPKLAELTQVAKQAAGSIPAMTLPAVRPLVAEAPVSTRISFPPPTETPAPALPLPRYLARFVDREFECRRIQGWLAENRRIITLTGLGGCGKTRLAVEVARQSVDAYEGRVFFVSFEDESGSADVLDMIAQATILSRAPSERFGEHLPSHLASIGRSLLMLDNLEYLSDRQVNQILDVLQEVPQVQALCTSRQPLGVEGEQILMIEPLPVPDTGGADGSLSDLAANPAVSLFVQRAQLVRQDFQLTERTAGPIVEVCRKLEGMPLALELAASWARTLTPTQMLSQIEEDLDNLSSRRRDAAVRHSSVSRAFDGSIALLTDAERDAFLRLAVLAGEWDLAAAQAVCPGVDLPPIFRALEDRALVLASDDGTEIRYCIRELLRSYAARLTPAALTEELAELHALHFQGVARDLRKASHTRLIHEMRRSRQNMARALDWMIGQQPAEMTLDMADAYLNYCELAGHPHEGATLAERIERTLKSADRTCLAYGFFLIRHARLLDDLGRSESADVATSAAEAILKTTDDLTLEYEIAGRRAFRCHRTGRYEEAIRIVDAVRADGGKVVPEALRVRLHLVKGNALCELDRVDEAIAAYQAAIDLAAEAGDTARVASARGNLGNAYRLLGRWEISESLLRQTLAEKEELCWGSHAADVHFMLAQLAVDRNRPLEAIAELNEVSPRLFSDVVVTLESIVWLAYALILLEECEAAAKLFGHAENYARRHSMAFARLEANRLSRQMAQCAETLGAERFESLRAIGAQMEYGALRAEVNRLVESHAA